MSNTTNSPEAVISSPEAIKALTHPLRVKLLALLAGGVELTATECAEQTGESVASCSFHLRQLEKYGRIERAESHGKERPWRIIQGGFTVRPEMTDAASVAAAQGFASVWLAEQFSRLQEWSTHVGSDDPEWALASTQTASDVWVTREELQQLSTQLAELSDRFAERSAEPALRPAGARRAHLFGAAWADIPDEPQGGAEQ